MSTPTDLPGTQDRCPCTSGLSYGECCGPVLAGDRPAPTAETLMRSRFTAFAVGDRDHLLRTWHPDTRPTGLHLDDGLHWYRLDVESATGGTPFDVAGEVEFTAHYRAPASETGGGRGSIHERSRFVRVDGTWLYLDGVVGG